MTAVNGIDVSNLDRTVSPGQNFYRFANGGWLERNPIPPEYSRWGAFEELNDLSNAQLRAILEESVADHAGDPNRRAIATLYATGMDEDACASHGLKPLADVFERVDRVQGADDVLKLAAKLRAECGVAGGGGVCAVYSLPDAKNSAWEVILMSQSGSLGIGDRDFYFNDDKEEIRDKYIAHVARMLALGAFYESEEDSRRPAEEMMKLETKIAEACLTKTEMRDPNRTYNKFEGTDDVAKRTAGEKELPWGEFFDCLGLPVETRKTIIVDNPNFFKNLASLLHDIDIGTWKTYLRYHILKEMANYLSPELKKEHFWFFGTTMTGQPEMKPRWKRVLSTGVTDLLEDSLGILYTDRHFNATAKKACLEMVTVCTEVLRKRIEEVDWMQDDTKEKAKEKLAQFRPMIGYPDKWDVDDIPQLLEEISLEKSYCANVRACNVRNFKKVIERIDKPVDPDRWEMPSTLVNAYFHPLKNVIVFPAAILQPPFFFHPTEDAPYGDPAVNFSAIGAVICHEISYVCHHTFFFLDTVEDEQIVSRLFVLTVDVVVLFCVVQPRVR